MTQFDGLDIVIRQRNSVVYAGIPQLGIYTKGNDVASALAKLEQWKTDVAASPEEMEFVSGLVREGRESRVARSVWRGVGVFAAKVAIFVSLFAGAMIGSGAFVASRVERTVERVQIAVEPLAHLNGKQFWAKVQKDIASAAKPDNDIPEAEKRELLANLRILAARWRPVATEAAGIFSDVPAPKDKSQNAN